MRSNLILSKSWPVCQEKKRAFPKITFSRPFLAAALLLLALNLRWVLLLGFAAAAVHEAGHLLALTLFGSRAEAICFRLSGPEIRYRQRGLNYRKEAAVALAGPTFNLIAAALFVPLALRLGSALLFLWIGCHVALAAFNLIPALPLDGGRALHCLLSALFPLAGQTIAVWFSRFVGLGMLGFGLSILLRYRNPTLFCAGLLIFLYTSKETPLQ